MFSLPKGEYSPNFLEFFKWSVSLAKENGKYIDVRNAQYVLSSGRCGGYCDGLGIVIAGKSKLFEKNFAHEMGHLKQIIDDSPLWVDEDWWTGSFDIPHFLKMLKLLALERDCERIVLEFNKQWKLFDEIEYIKEANSCLYSYIIRFLNRKWAISKPIYSKEILSLMPDHLVSMEEIKTFDIELIIKISKLLR